MSPRMDKPYGCPDPDWCGEGCYWDCRADPDAGIDDQPETGRKAVDGTVETSWTRPILGPHVRHYETPPADSRGEMRVRHPSIETAAGRRDRRDTR